MPDIPQMRREVLEIPAEMLHGPVSTIGSGSPVLGLTANDAAETALVGAADSIAAKGALAFVISHGCRSTQRLDHVRPNPDAPRHLKNATETR